MDLTGVRGEGFISGFVAAGTMLVSDCYSSVAHGFINTSRIRSDEDDVVSCLCCQFCFWEQDATGELMC